MEEKRHLLIYRVKDKGLEVFLVNREHSGDEQWQFPSAPAASLPSHTTLPGQDELLVLEPIQEKGSSEQVLAVEGDWHDIPSLKSLLLQDVQLVTDTLKQMVPDMEKGTYFAVKEAFRKIMPSQYEALKELKDILIDRNLTRFI